MAEYKKDRVGSIDLGKLEGSPEVVIRRLRTLVQDARKLGYTNLSLKRDCDIDFANAESSIGLDLFGYKKVSSEEDESAVKA